MKIAAHFVADPTPKMQQMRAAKPLMKRLIIINKDGSNSGQNPLRILARNVQDGQRVSVVDPPFESVELALGPSGSRPVSTRFSDAPQLKYQHRVQIAEALQTFRGTLIDGTLQPNVRLGNGLRLSPNPEIRKPQGAEKRRARDREANELRGSTHPPSKAPAKRLHQSDVPIPREHTQSAPLDKYTPPPPKHSPHDNIEHRDAQIAQRERELIQMQQQLSAQTVLVQNSALHREQVEREYAQLVHEPTGMPAGSVSDARIREARARERSRETKAVLLRYIKQKVELSEFKTKVSILEQQLAEQKLAQATAHTPPHHRFRQPETEVQGHDENIHDETGAHHDGSSAEQLRDYSLDNMPPPQALKNLRSRIQLPTRETMRSNGEPKQQ